MEGAHHARIVAMHMQKNQAIRQMEMTTLSLAAGLLQQFAGKSKAAALAVIAINKGLMIAQTIQATAAAQMRALADLGPIAGAAAAAKIALMGKIQVAVIAATGLVEAHQVTSGGGGNAATPVFEASPITGAPQTSATSVAPGEPRQATHIHITIQGKDEATFTSAQVRTLLEEIANATRDGGRVWISG
jgi:hypothetical protein